jgi:hypothetical protein
MIFFVVFTISLAATLVVTFTLTSFLNSFQEWDLDVEWHALITVIAGVIALFAGMALHLEYHVGLLWLFPGMVCITLFIFIVVALVFVLGARLGRWAMSLGTRANQARTEYNFHRNLDQND